MLYRHLAAVIILCLACLPAIAVATERSPNVVLFYCDDLGYADVACFGGKTKTPNIDRLAEEGVRFTDFYVTTAVCSASRAALLTGCNHRRVGIDGALGPKSQIGLNPAENVLPEVFKSKGYATAMFGKWHLGNAPQFLPHRQGFDHWFGVPYSHDMSPFHPVNPTAYPDLPLMEDDKVLKLNPRPGELTAAITERVVKYIDEHKDKPFFLYVPHPLPHVPLGVSKPFEGKSGDGLYGDVLGELDDSVGQVLAALQRNGLDEQTLVIFCSDNGPWLLYGDHAGSAAPLREGKATSFDGGVRVPFVARWPGKLPPGIVRRELASTIDLLPTMAKLIGADLPADRVIDGRDIWPLLSSQPGAKSPHEVFPIYWQQSLQAIRSGKWKLHFSHDYTKPAPAGSGGKAGKYATLKIGAELFDLDADPGELRNVAPDHPDVVEQLEKEADAIRKDLGDVATKQPGTGTRPAGRLP